MADLTVKPGTGCREHTHYPGCGCTEARLCCGCPVPRAEAQAQAEQHVADLLDGLDPGIVRVVGILQAAGFCTTDSGDGISKPPDAIEMPFPHVVAVVDADQLVAESHRMAAVLGDGWCVEGSYSPHDGKAILLASANERPEVNRG